MARVDRTTTVGRSVVTVFVANVALPASALVTGPVIARSLGVEDRGLLASVLAPFSVAVLLAASGLSEAVVFTVNSAHRSPRRILLSGVALGGVSGLIGTAVLWIVAPILIREPEYVALLRGLALLLPAFIVMLAVRAVTQAEGRFGLTSGEQWTNVLTRLSLVVVLSLAGLLTVTSAAWLTQFSALLGAGVLLLGLRNLRGGPRSAGDTRLVASYAGRTWFGSSAGLLILRVDQVLLVPLVEPRALGYYAVAFSIAEIPALGLYALRDVLFRAAANRNDPEVIARGSRTTILLMVPVIVLSVLACGPALTLLFGDEFAPSVPLAQILLLSVVPNGITMVLGAGLLSAGRPGQRSWVQMFGLAVSVMTILLLVPRIGASGAAFAGAVTFCATAGASAWLYARLTGFSVSHLLVPRLDDVAHLRGIVKSLLRPRGGAGR